VKTFEEYPEEWKEVKGYEGRYSISNHGRVRSHERTYLKDGGTKQKTYGRLLKNRINKYGYDSCIFSMCNKIKSFGVHRLVAEAFIENPKNKPQVNHKDSNRANNHIDNLEWATSKENNYHAHKYGFADNNSKKLKWGQVDLIREMYKWSEKNKKHRYVKPFNLEWLGRCFKVAPETIRRIVNNKTWWTY